MLNSSWSMFRPPNTTISLDDVTWLFMCDNRVFFPLCGHMMRTRLSQIVSGTVLRAESAYTCHLNGGGG